MLPEGLVEIPKPDNDPYTTTIGGIPADADFSIATDASGGIHTATPKLRRVGWGWVAICNKTYKILMARYGRLPGDRQTVQRGEVYAIIDAVATLIESAMRPINVYTDHLAIINATAADADTAWIQKQNGDMWEQLLSGIRGTSWKVIKVPAHIFDKNKSTEASRIRTLLSNPDLPDVAYIGNALADLYAGWGAEDACVGEGRGEVRSLFCAL